MTENFGTNFPTYFELIQRTSYLFVNMNELLDIARPISPKMKFIGGIAAAELLASSESICLDANVQQIFGNFLPNRNAKKKFHEKFYWTN